MQGLVYRAGALLGCDTLVAVNIMDGKSLNITEEKIEKLKAILPEAFTEDKIDWEKLKAALGEELVKQLTLHTDPVNKNAETENILYELLLKSGVSLTAKIVKTN